MRDVEKGTYDMFVEGKRLMKGSKQGEYIPVGEVSPYHADKVPGRNDPCPCGSGLKYKHCCMK